MASSLAEINVVPLVDVMLVLLIIFMVTAPMIQRGMDIKVPVSRAPRPSKASACSSPCPRTTAPAAHGAARHRKSCASRSIWESACARKWRRRPTSRCTCRATATSPTRTSTTCSTA